METFPFLFCNCLALLFGMFMAKSMPAQLHRDALPLLVLGQALVLWGAFNLCLFAMAAMRYILS